MLNQEVWQQLLSLESRDVTSQWFNRIHSRDLNARRAKEINAAAKQAREYFRNADESAYSVRPLLTFYGVACLSRSLLFLLRTGGGEEGLTSGHGLEAANWANVLSRDTAESLRSLPDLRVRTTAGFFRDFLEQTKNRMSIHVNSAGVDWHFFYHMPALGDEITLGDLFARIPDLWGDYARAGRVPMYVSVNELKFTTEAGMHMKVQKDQFAPFSGDYESNGYTVITTSGLSTVTATTEVASDFQPQFMHSYIQRHFGLIPVLHLVKPFERGARYSQLGVTYMVAYLLGMLVRYFPTQWMALIQGETGDSWWPIINRAQHFVETSYPELIIEMIQDILTQSKRNDDALK